MAKKIKKATPKKKVVKTVKKQKDAAPMKKAAESSVDKAEIDEPEIVSEPHPLEKGLSPKQKKYLEERISMCVKSYPEFTREIAKQWLLKHNRTTKVVKLA